MTCACSGDNAGNAGTRPRAVGLPVTASVDVTVHANTGMVDGIRHLGQLRALPVNEEQGLIAKRT
jgi:hypothetical protein